jgi:hypothetical protein
MCVLTCRSTTSRAVGSVVVSSVVAVFIGAIGVTVAAVRGIGTIWITTVVRASVFVFTEIALFTDGNDGVATNCPALGVGTAKTRKRELVVRVTRMVISVEDGNLIGVAFDES